MLLHCVVCLHGRIGVVLLVLLVLWLIMVRLLPVLLGLGLGLTMICMVRVLLRVLLLRVLLLLLLRVPLLRVLLQVLGLSLVVLVDRGSFGVRGIIRPFRVVVASRFTLAPRLRRVRYRGTRRRVHRILVLLVRGLDSSQL